MSEMKNDKCPRHNRLKGRWAQAYVPSSLRWRSRGGGAVERDFHGFTRQQNDRKHTQHRSERHKQTFATCDHKNERITLAPGQKSAGYDNANRQTLPHKKKAPPRIMNNQPTKAGGA